MKVVTTEDGVESATQTGSTWTVCHQQWDSEAQGAELLVEVRDTARCQTEIRSVLIYEEIPKSKVKHSNFWSPFVLAVVILLISCLIQMCAQSEVLSKSLAAIVLEATATAAFGYAGWLFSRASWGRRVKPMGGTAVKQSFFTVVSLVVLVVLFSLIPHFGFGPWESWLANIIKWLTDPLGSFAELLGWVWWPLIGLVFGFFSGMTIWRTEAGRRAFEQKHPHLHWISRKIGLKRIASWFFWRVNIGDVACSCDRHVQPSQNVA